MRSGDKLTVLHYVGADDDRGGIVSVVRALAGAGQFQCVLGVNRGFRQRRSPPLAAFELPALDGEVLRLRTLWRARAVAREVGRWLETEPGRIFHGHSRAGLAVALWLERVGETRVAVSVHCYGRRRWFYRWAAGRLGSRLFWLSPAMREYYGVGGDGWTGCIPGCVPAADIAPAATKPTGPPGRLRIAGVGMLVAWKRWHLVLEALAALPTATRARIGFTHIGAADDSEESRRYGAGLRERTKALGLEACVEWRGEAPSSRALLGESDCLVVASQHEPFSVAVLEALAAGVPVLAADSGGVRDVIEAPVNGWYFKSGDAADLARMLTMLVESDAVRRVRITREQLQPFTAPVVAAQWERVYEGLTGEVAVG